MLMLTAQIFRQRFTHIFYGKGQIARAKFTLCQCPRARYFLYYDKNIVVSVSHILRYLAICYIEIGMFLTFTWSKITRDVSSHWSVPRSVSGRFPCFTQFLKYILLTGGPVSLFWVPSCSEQRHHHNNCLEVPVVPPISQQSLPASKCCYMRQNHGYKVSVRSQEGTFVPQSDLLDSLITHRTHVPGV